MKRDKNFRIAKQTKRLMATILDPIKRNEYKNAMIAAQIAGETIYKSEKKSRKDGV